MISSANTTLCSNFSLRVSMIRPNTQKSRVVMDLLHLCAPMHTCTVLYTQESNPMNMRDKLEWLNAWHVVVVVVVI